MLLVIRPLLFIALGSCLLALLLCLLLLLLLLLLPTAPLSAARRRRRRGSRSHAGGSAGAGADGPLERPLLRHAAPPRCPRLMLLPMVAAACLVICRVLAIALVMPLVAVRLLVVLAARPAGGPLQLRPGAFLVGLEGLRRRALARVPLARAPGGGRRLLSSPCSLLPVLGILGRHLLLLPLLLLLLLLLLLGLWLRLRLLWLLLCAAVGRMLLRRGWC